MSRQEVPFGRKENKNTRIKSLHCRSHFSSAHWVTGCFLFLRQEGAIIQSRGRSGSFFSTSNTPLGQGLGVSGFPLRNR